MAPGDEILIFANPIAGRGRGQTIARRLAARLQADGYAVRVSTQRPDLLAADDLPATAKAAIVIGGDGTLRAVAERLCAGCRVEKSPEGDRSRHGAAPAFARSASPGATAVVSGPPLLVVPLGTANLMGRHLGIRWERATLVEQVSRALARGRVVHVDAGRANGKLFLLMVGVGFDAAVVHELDKMRNGPISYAHYVLPAALSLAGYQYPRLRVLVDGREVFRPAPAVAFVGNIREYGTGFPILTRARPDDGLLDACVLPCHSPMALANYGLLSLTGEHLLEEGVVYRTGRQVRIESPDAGVKVPVQIDGDPGGHTPVDIDLLPVRLAFIVPENA